MTDPSVRAQIEALIQQWRTNPNYLGSALHSTAEQLEALLPRVAALEADLEQATEALQASAQQIESWKRLARESGEKHVSVASQLGDLTDRKDSLEAEVIDLNALLTARTTALEQLVKDWEQQEIVARMLAAAAGKPLYALELYENRRKEIAALLSESS